VSTSTPTIQALQEQLADLQWQLAEAERARRATEQGHQLYEAIIRQMPVSASLWHLEQPDEPHSLRLVAANPACARMIGFDMNAEAGRLLEEIFPGAADAQLQLFASVVRSGQPRDLGETVSTSPRAPGAVFALQAIPLSNNHLCLLSEDVTERKRSEQMYRETVAQAETIRAQQAVLAELSTPLIPISEQVMVMPLVGAVDSQRAQQVLTALLEGIASSRARVAILDITGVSVVDTQVANALIRAAQAVKLLGAQVVLTGIRPEVAQTLVGLGTDLQGIVTRGSLQSGIAYATARK
jgi:rsbT co-antagonist protein RsbR